MIQNLGKYAHPRKKANSVTGPKQSSTAMPGVPKSKPDPVNMNPIDVGMLGKAPGTGAMPKGTIPSADLDKRSAGRGTAKVPPQKARRVQPVKSRSRRPFFGM